MSPTGHDPDRGFSQCRRVTRPKTFDEAYTQGNKFVGPSMVLFLRVGEGAALRLGVVASRKVGKSHDRNRARRLLREAWRHNRYRFRGNLDVVLVARRTAAGSTMAVIERELLQLALRAGIWDGESDSADG